LSGNQDLRLGRSEVETSERMIALQCSVFSVQCSVFCLVIQYAVFLKIQDDPFKYVSSRTVCMAKSSGLNM
jgi:hypothetical protein